MQGKNIVLCGMPGCGKTTVGKIISKKLNIQFIDLDLLIEEKQSMKIKQIFSDFGEEYFRELETKTLKELKGSFVLSLGGGAVMRDENIQIIKKIGKLFYIKTDLKNIYGRIKSDTSRPLLNCYNPYQKLEELFKSREERFNLADFKVNGNSYPDIVADEVIKIYENN